MFLYKIDFIRLFWYNYRMKTTYKEIAETLGKSENTIKGWKQKFPELLELVRIGVYCKKHGLDEETIARLAKAHNIAKGE